VLDFEGEGPFVWATNTNIDSSGTSGLLRLNPQQVFDNGAPAYANDVEGGNADSITGVASLTADGASIDATYGVFGRRIWCQTTEGLWVEGTTPAATGVLETGQFVYGLPMDTKIAMKADVLARKSSTAGPTITIELSTDDEAYTEVGTHQITSAVSTVPLGQRVGYQFGFRLTLTAAAGISPEERMFQVRAFPTPSRGSDFQVDVILRESVTDYSEVEHYLDVAAEYAFLKGLARTGEIVTYQRGAETFSVVVLDAVWKGDGHQGANQPAPHWDGICRVTFKEPAE